MNFWALIIKSFTNNMNKEIYLDILTNHLFPFANGQYEEGHWNVMWYHVIVTAWVKITVNIVKKFVFVGLQFSEKSLVIY